MRASSIVRSALGPAIAVDSEQRVVATNAAVRELLGYDQAGMSGNDLHKLLEVRDASGNRLTGQSATFWEMTRLGEGIQPFEMSLRCVAGEALRVTASVVVVVTSDDDYDLVYLLRPIYRRRRADEFIERLLADPRTSGALRRTNGDVDDEPILTPRQLEVLRHLADGDSAEEIAREIEVSLHTVRSHIRNILERLEVHSQIEAVSRAFRERLI